MLESHFLYYELSEEWKFYQSVTKYLDVYQPIRVVLDISLVVHINSSVSGISLLIKLVLLTFF